MRKSAPPSHGGTDSKKGGEHNRAVVLAAATWLVLAPISPPGHAEFNLNFMPDDGTYLGNWAYVSCGMSYLPDANCSPGGGMFGGFSLAGSHDDGTPFYQNMFTDANGDTYYQVIIGDYTTDDFVQEYIIKADGTNDGYWYCCNRGAIARSASAGDAGDRLYNMTQPYDTEGTLSSSSGTGSGNPSRVIMRQIVRDAQTDMLFLKDQFAMKPLISQTTQDAGFTSYIELDMRSKSYDDMTPIDPATEMVHTFELLNTVIPHGGGNYDFADRPETTYVTAGGFTYTDGTSFGGSLGTYSYEDAAFGDEFHPLDKDYNSFCDPGQNVDWSGNGACVNGDGSGGGFGWGGGGGMMGW